MLAKEAVLAKLIFPLFAQHKLDGIRVVIKDGVALTRSLKPVPNEEIAAFLADPRFEGLDGEIIVGEATDPDCFNKSTSFVRKATRTGEPWAFHVFDLHNLETSTTLTRMAYLESWYSALDDNTKQYISLVPTFTVNSMEELDSLEERYVEEGGEGLILRRMTALYKYGRSSPTDGACLKLKRFTDAEATVTGYYEEMHNGNEATTNALGRTERSSHKENKTGKGRLGGLEVVGLNGEFAGVDFRIGTGFNHALKEELWARRETLPGTVVKFKYVPIGAKDRPRFPVYLGERDMELDA